MKYIYLIVIILIISSFYKRKHLSTDIAQYKGRNGEKRVRRILRRLSYKKYICIDDIMLPSDSDIKNTQIDHIVISVYGIFVIETKNYSGNVSGDDCSDYWLQNINGRIVRFRNPLKQNYAHIMALKKFLNVKQDFFISIAAFSDECVLDIKGDNNYNVVNFKELRQCIKSYRHVVIDKSDLREIKDKIYQYNIYSTKARMKHVQKVQRKIDSEIPYMNRCPICGAKLVKKKGKYGDFMGCSNFPKCRFTSDT